MGGQISIKMELWSAKVKEGKVYVNGNTECEIYILNEKEEYEICEVATTASRKAFIMNALTEYSNCTCYKNTKEKNIRGCLGATCIGTTTANGKLDELSAPYIVKHENNTYSYYYTIKTNNSRISAVIDGVEQSIVLEKIGNRKRITMVPNSILQRKE
jgi:hypothetical protein